MADPEGPRLIRENEDGTRCYDVSGFFVVVDEWLPGLAHVSLSNAPIDGVQREEPTREDALAVAETLFPHQNRSFEVGEGGFATWHLLERTD